jgi:hypothetical protein
MNLKFKILTYNNASSDNFDFENEEICCTPTYSMIHNFLDAKRIMDYGNSIYFIIANQNFSLQVYLKINILRN